MSEINQIADLLQNLIKSRQMLAVGTAQSAAVPGSPGLYETSGGTIRAIATNFCYGNCLLAKVEGAWYAINPADNRVVVRSNVDRLIQRKPKTTEIEALSNAFIGIGGEVYGLLRSSVLSLDSLANRNINPDFPIAYNSTGLASTGDVFCIVLRKAYTKVKIKYLFSEDYLPLDTSAIASEPNIIYFGDFNPIGVTSLGSFPNDGNNVISVDSYNSTEITMVYNAYQYIGLNAERIEEIYDTVKGFVRYFDTLGEAFYVFSPDYYSTISDTFIFPTGKRFTLSILEIYDENDNPIPIGVNAMTTTT